MQIENMDLRKDIESLAIWYIPVVILLYVIFGAYAGYLKEFLDHGVSSIGTTISMITLLPASINLADNVVVAIWLYLMTRREQGRSILWFMLGMVANLFAAIMYICLCIYEEKAFNKQRNADSGADAPSPVR